MHAGTDKNVRVIEVMRVEPRGIAHGTPDERSWKWVPV
jgi:hypothetical protein